MISMTIEEVMTTLDNFCPIKVIYNKEVIFDDDALDLTNGGDVDEARRMLEKLEKFSQRQEIVYSIKIKFVHFHHSKHMANNHRLLRQQEYLQTNS